MCQRPGGTTFGASALPLHRDLGTLNFSFEDKATGRRRTPPPPQETIGMFWPSWSFDGGKELSMDRRREGFCCDATLDSSLACLLPLPDAQILLVLLEASSPLFRTLPMSGLSSLRKGVLDPMRNYVFSAQRTQNGKLEAKNRFEERLFVILMETDLPFSSSTIIPSPPPPPLPPSLPFNLEETVEDFFFFFHFFVTQEYLSKHKANFVK